LSSLHLGEPEAEESLTITYESFMKTKEIIKRARGFAKAFRVSKGKDFRLKDVDPDDTLEFTKEADKPRAKEALAMGVTALAELQDKLYAQDKWAVLLIFQAMDAAGKDGAIKHVMSGVNPQGCQVYSFKSPSNLRSTLPSDHKDNLSFDPIRSRSVFAKNQVDRKTRPCHSKSNISLTTSMCYASAAF
jgi:polyphosphate kinase 2 PPK2